MTIAFSTRPSTPAILLSRHHVQEHALVDFSHNEKRVQRVRAQFSRKGGERCTVHHVFLFLSHSLDGTTTTKRDGQSVYGGRE